MTDRIPAFSYVFRDARLLSAALTHPSYSNEHPGEENFERLECLGDRIVGFVAMERLYRERRGDQGDLTDALRTLVRESALAEAFERAGLGGTIRCGKGAAPGQKTPSDAYEAVVAAVYLDGGLAEAARFIEETLLSAHAPLAEMPTDRDYKSVLNEWIGRAGIAREVRFEPWDEEEKTARVTRNGVVIGEAAGVKREAEQVAARRALERLKRMSAENDRK